MVMEEVLVVVVMAEFAVVVIQSHPLVMIKIAMMTMVAILTDRGEGRYQ